jgi:valyl-tRNA synthetase
LSQNIAFAEDTEKCDSILELQTELIKNITESDLNSESFTAYDTDLKNALEECSNQRFENQINSSYTDINSVEGLSLFEAIERADKIENQAVQNKKSTLETLSFNLNSNLVNETLFNKLNEKLSELKEISDKINKEISEGQKIHQSNTKLIPKIQNQCI